MYHLELRDFILSHENWEELLTTDPYNLKISRDGNYIMFKYNQISSDFTIPLVREARGIIFRESDWECVCEKFTKFGNYGESYCPDIDWATASVQEKVDGSLIGMFYDNGWHICTNGTIDAFKAELNDVKYQNFGQLVLAAIHRVFEDEHKFFTMLDPKCTYIFELVSPYNRVVIPYEDTKLYFLGIRDMEDGKEWNPEDSDISYDFEMPKRYSLHSLEDVQKAANALPWDEEGYVVCDANRNWVLTWPNGETTTKKCDCASLDYWYEPEETYIDTLRYKIKDSRYPSERYYRLKETYSHSKYDDYSFVDFKIQFVFDSFCDDTIKAHQQLGYGEKIGFKSKEECQKYCDWLNKKE